MRTVEGMGMLLVNNARSKAYIQYLLRGGLKPAYVVLLESRGSSLVPGQRVEDLSIVSGVAELPTPDAFFNPDLPLLPLFNRYAIPWQRVVAESPNDAEVCDIIANQQGHYVIYSGPGGVIIRALFNAGKHLIHIHSGTLPEFRGSTTMYYEILRMGRCAASAIFLAPSIDAGPVLHSRTFPAPKGIDIDYLYDSHCRATVLTELLQKYVRTGAFDAVEQPPYEGAPYYIMHPVLRQMVRLLCGIEQEPTNYLETLAWEQR